MNPAFRSGLNTTTIIKIIIAQYAEVDNLIKTARGVANIPIIGLIR